MHEPNDDDVDRAYRAAVTSRPDADGARRRRQAVLEAVRALEGEAADPATVPAEAPGRTPHSRRAAANEARWSLSGAGWRGAVAACLMASAALLVVRLQEEPGTAVEPPETPLAASDAAARSAEPVSVPDALPAARPAAAPVRLPATPSVTQSVTSSVTPSVTPPLTPSVTPTAPPPAAVPATRPAAAPARQSIARPADPPVAPTAVPPAAPTAAPPTAAPVSLPVMQPPPPAVPSATQALPPPEIREQVAPAARAPAPAAAAVGKARAEGSSTANEWANSADRGSQPSLRSIPGRQHPDTQRDADGRTALALAVLRADVPMVKRLLAQGAQPQVPDRFGQTPQGYAEASGDPAMRQAFQGP